jgi:hypothetical protein
MGVRKTVFGSNQEKKCYSKLMETWGDKFNIYHNLPFLSVFSTKDELYLENLEELVLTDEEFEMLKKTSIDFTICDKKDQPLVCLEFDGFQNGFNVGTSYHLSNGTKGRKSRKRKIELKLKVAHGSMFPFLILGSDQFRGLSNSIRLTIADALIGEVMSNRRRFETINAGFCPDDYGYSSSEFDSLSDEKQKGIIEDWAIGIEIESDYLENPVFKKVAELSTKLEVYGYSYAFLNDKSKDFDKWAWIECTVSSRKYGDVAERFCMPEFKTPYCYFSTHLVQEIAKLLALEKMKSLAKVSNNKQPCQ